MKKTFSLFVASLLATVTGLADVVTPSQALQIAEDFLGEELAPQRVRGMRGVAAAPEQENAPLYVISRGDDQGFVLVSGDDRLTSIIGYTDHGNFEEDNLPPALQDLLGRVAEAVDKAQKGHTPARPVWEAHADWSTIDPLITSHWNQGSPWNDLCPICTDNGARAVAGCVAIAAAQIIYYFRNDLPHALQDDTPTYPSPWTAGCDVTVSYPKGTPIEYELMRDSYSGSEPAEFRNAVALLCYTVGACSNMNYWHSSATGISSAGHAMDQYFGLSGTYMYRERDKFPDEDWLALAYSSLAQGSPLLYSGYRSRDGSAHAFIYDGYDADRKLWHINFGWGGGYDGYYTIDYETAGDGYGEQQQIIHHIVPHHLNLSGEIEAGNATLYKEINHTVTVDVTNDGTAPVTSFSIYLMPSDEAPTSESTPVATNEQIYAVPGETVPVPFAVHPAELGDYYLYVTDRNGDVLTHQKVTVVEPAPQFTFQGLTATFGAETVETVQGTFPILNNNAITLYAEVSNEATATPGIPNLTFTLTQWDAEQGTEVLLQSTTIDDVILSAGESKAIACTFTDLPTDALLTATVTANNFAADAADALRFVVGGRTLTASEPVDGAVTLTGAWDPTVFAELASDAAVSAYDLTAVNGLQAPLTAANPNALFYVSAPVEGCNIIADGECADLRLTSGYDFRPVAPFHAAKAQFTPDFVPGVINTLILPFTASAPLDYLCRQHSNLGKSYFGNGVNVDTLEAGLPYFITSNAGEGQPFTGEDVDVMVQPDTALTKPFVGTFVARSLYADRLAPTNNYLVLGTDPASDSQYFEMQDSAYVAAPFTAIISHDSKKVRATVNDALEKAYKKLGAALADAQALYDALNANQTDSANVAMVALLDEGRALWHPMQEQASPVNKYIQRLEEFCEDYPRQVAVITEPVDYTSCIKNPSFETNSKTGWKTDSHAKVRSVSDASTYAVHAKGQYFLYVNYTNKSTEISQTVGNLPNGYYRLSVMVGSDADATIDVFAGDSVYAAPASELGRWYLTEAIMDSIPVTNGELTIGIKASNNWYKCDDFKLYYLGGTVPVDPDTKVAAPIQAEAEQPGTKSGLYDLQGRKLQSTDAMLPGVIYLYNGKKVLRTVDW